MKKFFLCTGAGLLVLIIAIAIAVGVYIGPIVKIGLEALGPKIIQASITVDSVDVSLLTGTVQIKGLMVGNPDGYNTPQAISVGSAVVSVDPFSVLSHKIVVRRVHVQSPEITLEGSLRRNNLNKIMENINGSHADTRASQKPAPTIEVDDFRITGAKVHVRLSGLGHETIPLPDIHLTGLGKDSHGLTPAQLASAVFKPLSHGTIKAVTSTVIGLAHGVENLGENTGKTIVKGVGKGVSKGVGKIAKGIGGLFGK